MDVKKIAMVGCGSMGGSMTLLFAEHGLQVSMYDPSKDVMDKIIQQAKEQHISPTPTKHEDYSELCESLESPKVFIFSLPHGKTGDEVIDGLLPFLEAGDFIVDCANEHWSLSQSRQGRLITRSVNYVGCGVSGGYQSARRGPSMSPGGDAAAIQQLMPLLEKVAARDARGRSCVGRVGGGGAGHYVKMVHNGIEHGMMSAISECWKIMNSHLGMSYEEIGETFAAWNGEGELKNTFLIKIGAEICEKKRKSGRHHHVLAEVQDKVVQDVDEEEGTGVWSNEEAVRTHIPAPTLSTAHFLRIASADLAQREHVKRTFHGSFTPTKIELKDPAEKGLGQFVEDLRWAVYTACLASYVQGLCIIDKADREYGWSVDFPTIVQVWRAGCIIQSDHIADLLEGIFTSPSSHSEARNLLYSPTIVSELKRSFEPLKRVVVQGVSHNAVIPSLSATLEYLKYVGNVDLPTQFYEAELDYFGAHKYDKKSEDVGAPEKGKWHFEWKPA